MGILLRSTGVHKPSCGGAKGALESARSSRKTTFHLMQGEEMAKNETRRIQPTTLSKDRKGFAVLQAVTNYAPVNAAYSMDALRALRDRMEELQRAETQANVAAASARDDATEAEWKFHNAMLGVKTQVAAQYGPNSDELAGLGLKKRSEYKNPARRKPGGKSAK